MLLQQFLRPVVAGVGPVARQVIGVSEQRDIRSVVDQPADDAAVASVVRPVSVSRFCRRKERMCVVGGAGLARANSAAARLAMRVEPETAAVFALPERADARPGNA